jgi:hypothetical protein
MARNASFKSSTEPLARRRDADRTRTLEAHGFRVIRFWNEEILLNQEGVLESIFEAIGKPVSPSPSPLPRRRGGEGVGFRNRRG